MKRLSLSLVALIACGGAPDTGTTTPAGGGAGGTTPAPTGPGGDVSFEVPPVAITGMVIEPRALDRPGVAYFEPKKKTTVEKQRQVLAATKDPVLRQAAAAQLASLLYIESKQNTANERALWTEARQVMRDVAAAVGPKLVDELTLRLLANYEMVLGDYAAAAKAWGELVTKNPKDKEVQSFRGWHAYSLVMQHKDAEALEVLKGEQPSEKNPDVAYVIAWAKLRLNDYVGAWQAMVAAAKGWDRPSVREDMEFELLWLAAVSPAPLSEILPDVFAATQATKPAQQYAVLVKLGRELYPSTGRWADAVTALEKAISIMGNAVPPADLPYLRLLQSDYTVRLDTPEVAARFGKQALDALQRCSSCAEKDKQSMVEYAAAIGRTFHNLYATANDIRYYQPANDLYIAAIPLFSDAQRRAQLNQDAENLQRTLKGAKAGTGTHDRGKIGHFLGFFTQGVQGCYERSLALDPKLGGNVVLQLESDDSGEIKGVTTEPHEGQDGLSAVAGCVTKYAKTWKLPKRGSSGGVTRIKLSYDLSPKRPTDATSCGGAGRAKCR